MIQVRWPAAGTRLHRARCIVLLDGLLLLAAGKHRLPQTLCRSHSASICRPVAAPSSCCLL